MKRFVIFSFEDYEAIGGWDDIVRDENHEICSFDTPIEAKKYATQNISSFDIVQIIDIHTGEKVI
jgi:hypothetical protein